MSHLSVGPSNSRANNPFQASPSPIWNDDALSPSGSLNTSNAHSDDFDSLLLAPINPDHQDRFDDDENFHLPSLDDSHFFDALPPRLPSPSTLFPSPPNDTSSRHLPPPSDRQASLSVPNPSLAEAAAYDNPFRDFESPFSDYLFPPSPPAEDRSRTRTPTRATSVVDLTDSPPQMTSKKRKAEELGESSAPKAKKTQSQPIRRSTRTSVPRSSQELVEVVDLEKVESKKDYEDFQAKQQAEAIRKQNLDDSNKPVKLAEFQCIICMDNPTDLTVTHCGHLFCSECLHSALNAGDKRSCPVCRTMINIGKPGAKPPKNGAFPLEMKLMTANKKGKQPARH